MQAVGKMTTSLQQFLYVAQCSQRPLLIFVFLLLGSVTPASIHERLFLLCFVSH